MLEAARQAVAFADGRTRADLDTNPMLCRATIHCIQEIGEAASRVSPEGRLAAGSLPWNQIVGMRHRLVHVYFDIDRDQVWEVVVRDLPTLIAALEQVLVDNPAP